MLGLRLPELLIIFVVLVLVFGANRIPRLGDALGHGIRNFKKTFESDDSIDVAKEVQQRQLPNECARGATPAAASKRVDA